MENYPAERIIVVAYVLPETRQEVVSVAVSTAYETHIVSDKKLLRIIPRDNRTRQP
jgi:hypothetical protein